MISALHNPSVLSAQHTLARNQQGLNKAMIRLSTGKRLNSGKDGPADLINAERLSAEIAALEAENKALSRMDSNARIAEGYGVELSNMATDLNGLVVQAANSAGMSDAEREALQLEIDQTVSSMQRISGDAVSSLDGIDLPNDGNAEAAALISDGTTGLASITSGGANDLASGNFADAQAAIGVAVDNYATVRGQIGAYQKNTIGPTVRSNEIALENIYESRSKIADADFARETSNLKKYEILTKSGMQLLKVGQQQQSTILDFFA